VVSRAALRRPFAVAGAIRGVPILSVLGMVSVLVMMTHLDLIAIYVGILACSVRLAAGWLLRRAR
jgi:hypothetical protein